jgi:hypothetical protein
LALASALLLATLSPAAFGYGAAYIHFAQLTSQLAGNAHYDYLHVTGLSSVDGDLLLTGVSTRWDRQISSIVGGSFRYNGPKSNLAGQTFAIKSATISNYGLDVTVDFPLPQMLGGGSTSIPFSVDYTGALEPGQARADIVGTQKRDALKIQNAYFNLGPSDWSLGGGAVFTVSSLRTSFNGTMSFQQGVGPLASGLQSDVVRIGVTNQTGIPIGATVGLLDIVSASMENSAGLSSDANWAASNLAGRFHVTLATALSTGTAATCTLAGDGTLDVHSGAFDITGHGRLLNYFELTDVQLKYTPTATVVGAGKFSSPVYSGDVTLCQDNGTFGGTMKGKLVIPADVALFGGQVLESVTATLNGQTISGDGYVNMLMPRECFERCAEVCLPVPYCSKWWLVPPTCLDWDTKDVCVTKCLWDVCIDPMVRNVPFAFRFDGTTGHFSFVRTGPQPREANADVALVPNWNSTAASSVNNGQTDVEYIFNIEQLDAGLLFRTAFTDASVTQVNMAVTTPEGLTFSSADGALPNGYATGAGYSRFNASAGEQIIVLSKPTAGTYRVHVTGTDQLGGISVQCLIQDTPPACEAVIIEHLPQDGLYRVSCSEAASVTSGIVAAYLVPEDGSASTLAATGDVGAKTHGILVDTTTLEIPAGNYHVSLAVLDGTDSVGYCTSHDVIVIPVTGRPEPPSSIRYQPEDGAFIVQWTASPTADVLGYVVQYVSDLASFAYANERFVAADGTTDQQVEITGLENGASLLVRVIAVAQDTTRSAASEVIRVTPMPTGITRMPRIVSTPDESATVGLAYAHLPVAWTPLEEGEIATWTLDQAPAGMSIQADTGLLSWTPTSDQLGEHDVAIRITLTTAEGTTTATQVFTIEVNPATDLTGTPEHSYSWLSCPSMTTSPDADYGYSPSIVGPDERIKYDLQIGPEGMTVDSTTGRLTWQVPSDATSQWVRLRAIVGDEHEMTQDYYLFVQREDHVLTSTDETCPILGGLCGAGVTPTMCLTGLSLLSLRRRRW